MPSRPIWGDSVDATSATLMKNAIINEFVLDYGDQLGDELGGDVPDQAFLRSERRHVARRAVPEQADQDRFLRRNRRSTRGTAKSRASRRRVRTSRRRRKPTAASLCWEANVINFNGKPILGSSNAVNITTAFQNGWMKVDFPTTGLASSAPADTHTLVAPTAPRTSFSTPVPPAVRRQARRSPACRSSGSLVQTFRPSPATSYAGTFAHKYESGAPKQISS